VWVWSSGFLNLKEFLTVRLLMPTAPIILAVSFCGWFGRARDWRPSGKVLGALLLAATIVLGGTGAATQHTFAISKGVPFRVRNFKAIAGLFRAFARQFPSDQLAAVTYEPIFYLTTGRTCISANLNPFIMLGEIVNFPVRYLLMGRSMVGTRDLTMGLVKDLNKQVPDLVTVVREPSGRPTGLFVVNRSKLVARPTPRTGPR
ncbi:MAG: hypothetical protein KGR26_09745, partial [Cyanobacteria bacterium REEB65]|nr:hypothetical protein [Cyanobacteria bacterium REEB65]